MIFIVSTITALFWHFLLERMWLANLGSTLTAFFLTIALASSYLNFYGDQIYIDMLQVLIIAFIISVFIGYLFKATRRKSAK